jgi:hypothetical protein
VCDVVFQPDSSSRVAICRGYRSSAGYRQDELTILVFPQPGDSPVAFRIGDGVIPPYSSPTFLPAPGYPLLVGSADTILAVDLHQGDHTLWIDSGDLGWASSRSFLFNRLNNTVAVVWTSQAGSFFNWYRVDPVTRSRVEGRISRFPELWVTGVAQSPSGRQIVVCYQYDYYKYADEFSPQGEALGRLRCYQAEPYSTGDSCEVVGFFERDFSERPLAESDGRRQGRRGRGVGASAVYIAKSFMSNPVFVDEQRVVVGLPGGNLRMFDLITKEGTIPWQGASGVNSLDCAFPAKLLCGGFEDGTVCVWKV